MSLQFLSLKRQASSLFFLISPVSYSFPSAWILTSLRALFRGWVAVNVQRRRLHLAFLTSRIWLSSSQTGIWVSGPPSAPLIVITPKRWWQEHLAIQVFSGGLEEDKSLQRQLDFSECFLHTCNSTGAAGLGVKDCRGYTLSKMNGSETVYLCATLSHLRVLRAQ